MVLHNGTILLCGGGGNSQQCLQLDHGLWKQHSTFNEERIKHSAVNTKTATFLFGGRHGGYDSNEHVFGGWLSNGKTFEYLPKDSTTWLMGKTEIPKCFWSGCAISVKSDKEIWLIGGWRTEKRILSFNVKDHTFQELPTQLNAERMAHRCAFIPNTKRIMITGGSNYPDGSLNSTEIIDTEDGSVTIASPMNSKRAYHGMGIFTIDGGQRLAAFGGSDGYNELDSIELYNTITGKWDTTNMKLKEAKIFFGFLSVKLADVISHL